MAIVRGPVLAFIAFAASFALHVVGGATDQGWLFAIAVALIFVTATGFPAIALLLAGQASRSAARVILVVGTVAGVVLTAGALWAANDRAFAAWHPPVAIGLVVAVSAVILALAGRLGLLRARAGSLPRGARA